MFAIGRKPQVEKLGLDKVGIKTDDNGVIQVDDYSQTNIPNIYSVNHSFLNSVLFSIFITGRGLYRANGFNTRCYSRRSLFSKYAF
jgi:hypothetical protein